MGTKHPKLQPFVPIRRDLLKDPTWRTLSNKAKVIYLYLRYNSINKTTYIKLPYSQLLDMMSSQTISNGFRELEQAGFIRQISKGGMSGRPAIYEFIGPFADPYQSRYR